MLSSTSTVLVYCDYTQVCYSHQACLTSKCCSVRQTPPRYFQGNQKVLVTCLTCRTRLKNWLLSKHLRIRRCHVLVCRFFYGYNFTMFPVLWLTARDVSTYCHTMKIKGKENINNKCGLKKKKGRKKKVNVPLKWGAKCFVLRSCLFGN